MVKFRQKTFSEYDAMRSLYIELMKRTNNDRSRFPVINTSALLPILKGNNIVIERFVISSSIFGKDTYRMYIKIGAKAKLPDDVRLPSEYHDERFGKLKLSIGAGVFGKDRKDNAEGKSKGPDPLMSAHAYPEEVEIKREVGRLLGEAIKYDKKSRQLVLEFRNMNDAIRALSILPFGIDYKIYLLDA